MIVEIFNDGPPKNCSAWVSAEVFFDRQLMATMLLVYLF